METGHDILFFWVARMIFFGIENMGDIPFHTVYLHGLVRDPEGVKMSKTRGNVTDPLEMVELYGADAVRFALTTGTSAGNDMRLNQQKLEASRNFANKLWNAARFVIGNLQSAEEIGDWKNANCLSHREDRWIMSRLNRVTEQTNTHMREFQFGEAQRAVHDFLWNEFCDWYIEMCKTRLSAADAGPSPLPTLAHVLEATLRLLHPFLPFVTEEIWGRLMDALNASGDRPNALIIAPYPVSDSSLQNDDAEREVESVIELVRAARNLRAEFRVDNSLRLPARLVIDDRSNGARSVFDDAMTFICSQGRIDLEIDDSQSSDGHSGDEAVQVLAYSTLAIALGGSVDLAVETERLRAELSELRKYRQRIERNLANENFVNRAPEEVVERERERLANADMRIEKLDDILGRLDG